MTSEIILVLQFTTLIIQIGATIWQLNSLIKVARVLDTIRKVKEFDNINSIWD